MLHRPPRFVRAALYRYEFTSPRTLLADGAWWRRRRLARLYDPAVSLTSFARTIRP